MILFAARESCGERQTRAGAEIARSRAEADCFTPPTRDFGAASACFPGRRFRL